MPTARPRPNILFLFPDQHRYDWLGGDGGIPIRTPSLDELSQRGVRFSDAVCPSPLCAPSRACLAAGMEYDRCRTPSNGENYPLDLPSVYAILRDSGYHVMGCGKFDLAKALHDWEIHGRRLLPEWGFSDGIDNEGKWDGINSGREAPKGPYMAWLEERGLRETHVRDFDRRREPGKSATFPTPLPDEAYCDNWVARNGLKLLDRAPAGKPWFLQVNFTGPHDPWDITESMEASCRGRRDLPQPNRNEQFGAATHLRVRQNYSAMVENIDRWLGVYVETLRKRGELDSTVVVYSSDHGEMLGDHGHWGKGVPYHPSVGVPLIVAGPGVVTGQAVGAPTTTLDLTATFLELAGLDIPGDMDSRSLVPVLAGECAVPRDVVRSGLHRWRLAYDGRHKLIRGFGPRGKGQRAADGDAPPALLLFDRHEDPLENRNLAEELPEAVERLGAWL